MNRFPVTMAWVLAGALSPWTTAAGAQDAAASEPETVEVVPMRPSDTRELVSVYPWSVSAGGGVSARNNGPDMTWEALTLSRQVGNGYVRASAVRYHGAPFQSDSASGGQYLVGTLGTGVNLHGWIADAWVSAGRQDYGSSPPTFREGPGRGAKGSAYYSAGGDFGKVLSLGGNWYLTPMVAGSYAHGKLLREVVSGPRNMLLETGEPAWSANGTLRIDHAFGAERVHYLGAYVSQNWTSNGLSEVRYAEVALGKADVPFGIKRYSDAWVEAGATATIAITPRLQLDLFASRGVGMLSGNTTSAGMTLRRAF
jgi:hypothetical protein